DGSIVSGNSTGGFGGGISAVNVTLSNSTVSGNAATGAGGGISAQLTATLANCSLVSGTSAEKGAGIFAPTAKLTNSTVSDNHASRNGGGIFVTQFGDLLNCTIVLNTAGSFGGGVMVLDGSVTVKNTIIALNHCFGGIGQDVSGLFVSHGHNLVQDPESGAANTNFTDPLNQDILGVDPKLGGLAFNGGPTQTHALLAGSLAIDHGDNLGA